MAIFQYELDETVAIVTMNRGENVFNLEFLNAFLATLDEVEQSTDARTLVVNSAHEKIFSNGIDLKWLVPVIQNRDLKTCKAFFYTLNRLFARIITYPLVTIAAITGHAFAGGAILACAFDFRFMRSDRGYFCLPEVDLGIPLLPGMNALLKKAVPQYKLEEMEYTGNRLTAFECEAHHIVLKACHMDQLMAKTLSFAKPLNKARAVIFELKQRMNQNIIQIIEHEDPVYIESGKYMIGDVLSR
jgi:enoyl-CoA hydratase/carnithine racemase